MRAVRAHHEKKLEQQFVRVGVALIRVIPEVPITVLRTDLTELAWPVGENTGKAGVRQVGVGGVAGAVKASADGPAPVHAIIGRGIQAEGVLRLEGVEERELIAVAPEKLGAEEQRIVNGTAERLPAKRRVRAVKIGDEVGRIESRTNTGAVVSARIGEAQVDIGGLAQIAVRAQVADDAHVLATVRTEQFT